MKRFFCMFMAITLVFSLFTFTVSADESFSDLPKTHWAYDAVMSCVQKGWFGGYPDGTFKPGATITRAEVMKVLVSALNLNMSEPYSYIYEDVSVDDWYAPYVEAGKYLFYDNLIFSGKTTFRPNVRMSREDTVYTLVVATKQASLTKKANLSLLESYRDKDYIKEMLKPYLAVGIEKGLINGYNDGTIGPKGSLTRAEFASLLYRAFNGTQGNDNTQAPSITLDPQPLIYYSGTYKVGGTIDCKTDIGTAITVNGQPLEIDKKDHFSIKLDIDASAPTIIIIQVVNVYGYAKMTVTLYKENTTSVTADESTDYEDDAIWNDYDEDEQSDFGDDSEDEDIEGRGGRG